MPHLWRHSWKFLCSGQRECLWFLLGLRLLVGHYRGVQVLQRLLLVHRTWDELVMIPWWRSWCILVFLHRQGRERLHHRLGLWPCHLFLGGVSEGKECVYSYLISSMAPITTSFSFSSSALNINDIFSFSLILFSYSSDFWITRATKFSFFLLKEPYASAETDSLIFLSFFLLIRSSLVGSSKTSSSSSSESVSVWISSESSSFVGIPDSMLSKKLNKSKLYYGPLFTTTVS